MICRTRCGACCIIPSISSLIPGMPDGKPAFTHCIQLDENHACKIINSPARPGVCEQFKAEELVCGTGREEALAILTDLQTK